MIKTEARICRYCGKEQHNDHARQITTDIKQFGETGLWKCTRCKKLNYAASTVCYECGGSIEQMAERE
jgi:RNA polymerase subunit RPABC4/transcription elongation factor Spt4